MTKKHIFRALAALLVLPGTFLFAMASLALLGMIVLRRKWQR